MKIEVKVIKGPTRVDINCPACNFSNPCFISRGQVSGKGVCVYCGAELEWKLNMENESNDQK